MRTFAVTLAANTNSSAAGESISLTAPLVELGAWSMEVEKELTKVTPSEQTLKINDSDGSIWAWMEAHLAVTGGTTALFPPWVTIDVEGERQFTGVTYPRLIRRDRKTKTINLTAEDWSSTFKSRYLGAASAEDDLNPLRNPWLRPYPRAVSNRPATVQSCQLTSLSSTPGGYDGLSWHGPEQWVEPGDFVTCDLAATFPGFPAGKKYKIAQVGQVATSGGYDPNWWWGHAEGLGQDIWDYIHKNNIREITADFTRVAQSTDRRAYYVVTKTVSVDAKGVYELDLDNVDGLAPGDSLVTLGTANAQSWTLLQVDAEALQVVTKEEVQGVVANVSHLFFSEESLKDLVLDDARMAIKRALTLDFPVSHPYSVDFQRFIPPTVPNPVLVWLPLRPMGSQDLSTIRSLDQGLTDFRVYGAGAAAWDGTPEAGWISTATTAPRAPWSSQLLASPSSIMPDESATLAPTGVPPNKVLAASIRDTASLDPLVGSIPAVTLIYDYLQMRRILIRKDRSVQITAWTGDAWGATVNVVWPGAAPILSASVFPGHPGAVVGLTSVGLQLVQLPAGTASEVLAIPSKAADGTLKTTPWGLYLVGSTGYGRITYAGGGLGITWVTLTENAKTLMPTTFQALSADTLMVLARFDGPPSTDGAKVVTETHLLRLDASPGADASLVVLATEKLLDGVPRLAGAFRDPTQPERIFGHCGGRLFVYGRTLPLAYAIERYTPSGLKALELIEHVCQVLNAVAVPDPLGCLHLISRGLLEDPIDLQVDRIAVQETTVWEHFYSVIRVSAAQDSSVFSDVRGVAGGDALEYSQHPFLWTQSGCSAVAESMAPWFGTPRGYREETWFWAFPDLPAPWESLPPLATVRINGEASKWLVMSLSDHKVKGKAQVKLVEVF